MAWLQNLAGRAEDLLNKIDQNAATVLNDGTSKVINQANNTAVTFEEIHQEPLLDNMYIHNEKPSPNRDVTIICENNRVDDLVKSSPDIIHEPEHIRKDTIEAEDFFEKSKTCSSGSKSMSSHNSFIFTEDVQNYDEKIEHLELEIQNLNKQLLNLQHLYAELRNENANLLAQVETSSTLVSTAQSEMEQYKARAQKILQEKENLIALKSENKAQNNSDYILTNYNDELKKELEFQQNKNVELTEKAKKLNNEVAYFQQQLVLTQKSSQQSVQLLEENLQIEKRNRITAEEDCRQKSNQLHLKVQELGQNQQFLHAKTEEISKLQDAIRRKTDINVNSDLEVRIKSLTDTLMLKQNAMEQITTERNALRIQLEKLQSEYHTNLIQLERAQVRVVNMNDTDDVKSQVPHFLKMSPLDAGVTRRVKHAYSTVDAISVRTGIFLRRYPLARVFVFCYMILLHFWALILLFIYAPSSR